MTNPYDPPPVVLDQRPNYLDQARLLKAGFLYRKIEFDVPFQGLLVYSGWNFLQRIRINDILVWKRVSWVVIHRQAQFQLPAELDPQQRQAQVDLRFSRGLMMEGFSLRIGQQVVYDEPPGGL